MIQLTMTSDDWVALPADLKGEWKRFVLAHGLEPHRVGFPVTIETTDAGETFLRFRYFTLNEHEAKYIDSSTGEAASTYRTIPIVWPVPEMP